MILRRRGRYNLDLDEVAGLEGLLAGLGQLHLDYEQCHPLDGQCVARNAQRQQEDFRTRAEMNRTALLANCEANCDLNPTLPCYCAQYGGSDRPGSVYIPATPSSAAYTPPSTPAPAAPPVSPPPVVAVQTPAPATNVQPAAPPKPTPPAAGNYVPAGAPPPKPQSPTVEVEAGGAGGGMPGWVWLLAGGGLLIMFARGGR